LSKFLDFTSKSEGADYNTIVGGKTFEDYSKHPGVVGLTTSAGPSTAAGRYQITKTTYDDIAAKLGIKDFSPESQDKIAQELIRRKGALEDVQAGRFPDAIKKLGKTWASFSSSTYNQPKNTAEKEAKLLAESKGSLSFDDLLPATKDSKGSLSFDDLLPKEEKQNWLGTGPEMTTEEYFRSGFEGRGITAALKSDDDLMKQADDSVVATYGKSIKDNPKKYKDLWNKEYSALKAQETTKAKEEAALNPAPSTSESFKQFGEELVTNPWKTAKSFLYELGKDPLLFVLGGGGGAIEAVVGASKLAKTAQAVKTIGAAAIKPAATGAALETFAEAGNKAGLDPQAIANTAAMFGAFGATMKAGGMALKAAKTPMGGKPKQPYTEAEFEAELNKAEEEVRNMGGEPVPKTEAETQTPKASDEATKILDDNPSLSEAGDVFKGDTTTEQTPVNVIHRVIADTILNNRAARIFRESLERMVPSKKIRERMTMAIEGAKETDRLLTDEQKRQTLEGDTPEVRAIKEKSGEKVDPGLKGYLSFYQTVSDYLAGYTAALHPKAFDTFWENFTRKNKIESLSFEKQKEFFIDKKEKLDYTVRMLEELPSEEKAIKVLKVIQDKLRVIGEQAKTEGLFDQLRQNYVTHVLDFSDSALSKAQQISLRDRILGGKESRFVRDFAQHRIYKTIRDLEKRLYEAGQEMGIDTRGVKVQRDIARIAEVYQQSMMNAVIQKKAINFLAKQKAPLLNGKQLELLTKDHKVAFENGYVKFTGHGSEALKDYMVHPDLVDALGHLFTEKDPGKVLKILSGVSMLSKTITTMASLFHATSLAWARAGATPYGMLKEIGTGFKGTKAALETIRHDGLSKEVDAWTRSGLKFETEDIQQGILPEVAKNVDNFITKLATSEDIRLTRKVIDPLDAHVLQTLNTFTWDFMHAAGKFATAQYIFAKIKTRNPDMPDHVIRNEVSAFVNNTFGGLDWLKIASEVGNKVLYSLSMKAYGKQGRTWLQIAMFAPDWTISTLRSYTKALPKDLLRPKNWEIKEGAKGLFNPKTSGDLARRYVATTAVMWLTFLNGINVATSGHYIWENDDPTRIDLGDGTTMQAAKHSMEGPHWLLHPIKTGFNKMGYVPKTLAALGSPYVNTPLDVAKTIAEPFVPFQVSAAIQAPKGEKLKRGVASFVGLPIYGQTNKANTSPEVLMERKKQRKETMRANKEKKLERM
jgi:muramidase (phage lysozyme)